MREATFFVQCLENAFKVIFETNAFTDYQTTERIIQECYKTTTGRYLIPAQDVCDALLEVQKAHDKYEKFLIDWEQFEHKRIMDGPGDTSSKTWKEWVEKIRKEQVKDRFEDILKVNSEDYKVPAGPEVYMKSIVDTMIPVLAQNFPPFVHIGDLIYFKLHDKIDSSLLPPYIQNAENQHQFPDHYLLLAKTRIMIPNGIAYIIINACNGRPNHDTFQFLDKL